MHHLAMGLQRVRAVDRGRLSDGEVNRLVRALGVLQTVGQTIAGVRWLLFPYSNDEVG